jgi:hypothetical protein
MSPKGMLDTSIKIQNNVLPIDTDARKRMDNIADSSD